jgi:hypothetical protein
MEHACAMRPLVFAGALLAGIAGGVGCGAFLPASDDDEQQSAAPTEPEPDSTLNPIVVPSDQPSGGGATVGSDAGGGSGGTGAGGDATAAPRKRVVFVTSLAFAAKEIGGVVGGDALCTARAKATNGSLNGRTFVAWLSSGTSNAGDRLQLHDGAFVLTDGTLVAASWDALTTKPLLHAINLDETGATRSGKVWTGTSPSGVEAFANCGGWKIDTGTGHYGTIGIDRPTWSSDSPDPCTTKARLYCFEI